MVWGWSLAVLIAAGSLVGYLTSRTVGLPLSGIEEWGPVLGYLSIVVEAALILLFVYQKPWSQGAEFAVK